MLEALLNIKELLDKANDWYISLQDGDKEKMFDFHHEHWSLPHCLRFGLQAAEELIEGVEEDLRLGILKKVKVGRNQIYYDKLASVFVVEELEYFNEYAGEPYYSVVDEFDLFIEAFDCAENPSRYRQMRLRVM